MDEFLTIVIIVAFMAGPQDSKRKHPVPDRQLPVRAGPAEKPLRKWGRVDQENGDFMRFNGDFNNHIGIEWD